MNDPPLQHGRLLSQDSKTRAGVCQVSLFLLISRVRTNAAELSNFSGCTRNQFLGLSANCFHLNPVTGKVHGSQRSPSPWLPSALPAT